VNLVGTVGDDFFKDESIFIAARLTSRPERAPVTWAGNIRNTSMNATLVTDLNVFANFNPKLRKFSSTFSWLTSRRTCSAASSNK
jgi:hypothetical protein